MQLTDQVAIITGSARGIGRATALCLAREGTSIVVADVNAAGAQEAAAAVESLGRRALAVETDVADQDQVQAMVQRAVETFGRIDILVNNAGNAVLTPLLETPAAVWDRTLKIGSEATKVRKVAQVVAMVEISSHYVSLYFSISCTFDAGVADLGILALPEFP
jgi:NAD(P)-dependent dehydrogenase (short-subunit alcohol dehydrogenase family)